MKLIIMLILSIQLFAMSFKNYEMVEIVTGSESSIVENNKETKYGTSFLINSYNDIIFNKHFTLNSTLNFTKFPTIYSRTYNSIVLKKQFFELSELVLNYHITSNNILSAGLFSFKYGAFSEFTRIGVAQTDSLSTLYYLNLTGLFYTNYYNGFKTQIGYGLRNKKFKLPEDRYDSAKTGSDIIFLFLSKKINKSSFKLNFGSSKITTEKMTLPFQQNTHKLVNIGRLNIGGLGYEYDDREDTGNLYYGILGISETHFNGVKASPINQPLKLPGVFLSNEGKKTGYSLLLGYKKQFDTQLFNKDLYSGIEYFHASKYWMSYTSDKYNVGYYSWGNLGDSYKFYTGVELNPKSKIGIYIQHEHFQYRKLKGGNSVEKIDDYDRRIYLRLDFLF